MREQLEDLKENLIRNLVVTIFLGSGFLFLFLFLFNAYFIGFLPGHWVSRLMNGSFLIFFTISMLVRILKG